MMTSTISLVMEVSLKIKSSGSSTLIMSFLLHTQKNKKIPHTIGEFLFTPIK